MTAPRCAQPGITRATSSLLTDWAAAWELRRRADGLDAVDTHSGNCALISAEVVETVSPLRVLRTELVPDSGGLGKYRGGLGMLRDYQLLASSAVLTAVTQRGSAMTAPWGYEGGGAGGFAGVVVNPGLRQRTQTPHKGRIAPHAKGRGDPHHRRRGRRMGGRRRTRPRACCMGPPPRLRHVNLWKQDSGHGPQAATVALNRSNT